MVIVQGHIDSRVSDVMDAISDAPGANDDGSGSALVLEAARVLSGTRYPTTIIYALLSGALTSGIGYAIWYSALPGLKALQASTVQLSVPVITALAGTVLLGEALSLRLVLGAAAVLGGIALVLCARHRH